MERKIHESPLVASKTPSRRLFLQRAAGTGLATVAGIALIPGLSRAGTPGTAAGGTAGGTAGGQGQNPGTGTGAAAAPSANDLAILNFALLLERLEAAFYNINGDKAFLGAGTLKSTIAEIRDHENAHVMLLEGALGANARPKVQFQGLDAATLTQFLTMAQTFEDVGVSAYLGAAPLIQDKGILATAAGIMAVEARHAGGIRSYRKTAPSAGNPAEGGDQTITLTEDREAVNRARTADQVIALVAPFIVGGVMNPPATTPGTTTPPAGGTGTTGGV